MKLPFVILPMAFMAVAAFAAAPKITDINEALAKGQSEKKMVFLQYGREACGNCQALKTSIKNNRIPISASKFVYADLNCDDAATSKAFSSKFNVTGNTLPFVVIVAPDGRQLAARSGYGSDTEFTRFIRDAEKALKK